MPKTLDSVYHFAHRKVRKLLEFEIQGFSQLKSLKKIGDINGQLRSILIGLHKHIFTLENYGIFPLCVNLETVKHLDKLRVIMIRNVAVTHVQSVDFFQLVPGQRKVPDIEILLHAIFMHSLGDNSYAPVRLGAFPSFVIDAFAPKRPMKNKDRRRVAEFF